MKKIPAFIEQRVIDLYMDLSKQKGSPPTAREVYEKLSAEQGKRTRPVPLPSLRKVQLVLTKARPKIEEEMDIDKSWSLGAMAAHGIPAEASADLLKLWRLCLAYGLTLTVREAKWVAYLRAAVYLKHVKIVAEHNRKVAETPDASLHKEPLTEKEQLPGYYTGLLAIASHYARHERVSDILGVRNDTADLDAAYLTLSKKEQRIAWSLGLVPLPRLTSEDKRSLSEPEHTMSEWAMILSPGQLAELIAKTEAHFQEHTGLSEEDDWVYALGLRYLAQGPKWARMTGAEHAKVRTALKERVTTVHEWDPWEQLPAEPGEVWGAELLEAVGYEVEK